MAPGCRTIMSNNENKKGFPTFVERTEVSKALDKAYKKFANGFQRPSILLSLEPRMMFDGAAPAVVDDIIDTTEGSSAESLPNPEVDSEEETATGDDDEESESPSSTETSTSSTNNTEGDPDPDSSEDSLFNQLTNNSSNLIVDLAADLENIEDEVQLDSFESTLDDLDVTVASINKADLNSTTTFNSSAFVGTLSDIDGIDDDDDLDDDNDGILDTDEGVEAVNIISATAPSGGSGVATYVGETDSGVGVTIEFSGLSDDDSVIVDNGQDRIDNASFAIQTGDALTDSDLRIENDTLSALEGGADPLPIDISFTDGDVSEVFFHFNSLDQVNLSFDPANNPGIAFEILAINQGSDVSTVVGELEIEATNVTGGDISGAQ